MRDLLIIVTLLTSLAGTSRAAIDPPASNVAPATVYLASGHTGAFNVTWRVRTTTGPSVSSSQGRFLIPDSLAPIVLGTVPHSLSRSVVAGGTALISEAVSVPQAVIQRALDLNASEIVYERQFSDPSDALPVAIGVRLVFTGAQAAGLAVTRQALAFDDDTPARIVAPGAPLAAWSELTFSGTGLLEGVWEIAEPPGTSGEPVFRTLQLVRRFVPAAAPLRLDSPRLPTRVPGLYLLRLRLTQPQPDFDPPQIRYFVTQAGATPVAREVRVFSPGPGAVLEDATRFSWAPIEGVHSWLLELYERSTGLAGNLPELGAATLPETAELAQLARASPVAGVVLPGSQTSAALGALPSARLRHGTAYLWRLRGVDRDGVVVGESPWRVVRMP